MITVELEDIKREHYRVQTTLLVWNEREQHYEGDARFSRSGYSF